MVGTHSKLLEHRLAIDVDLQTARGICSPDEAQEAVPFCPEFFPFPGPCYHSYGFFHTRRLRHDTDHGVVVAGNKCLGSSKRRLYKAEALKWHRSVFRGIINKGMTMLIQVIVALAS